MIARYVFGVGILLLVVAGVMALMPETAQTQPSPTINGNCNAVGNNNLNCSTIIARPTYQFSDQLKADLVSKISKDRPVNIEYANDQESYKLANQIFAFLGGNGFHQGEFTAVLNPGFPPGLHITVKPDSYDLMIGAPQ